MAIIWEVSRVQISSNSISSYILKANNNEPTPTKAPSIGCPFLLMPVLTQLWMNLNCRVNIWFHLW
jgi:hypothetical protein